MEKAKGQKKVVSTAGAIAMFSTFALAATATVINPVMSDMMQYWGAQGIAPTTIRLMNTIPSGVVVIATILSGILAGKYFSYKTLAVTGFVIFTIFGAIPYFFVDNFAFVLFSRAMLGLGLGLVSPLGNAAVMQLYEPIKAGTYIGYGAIVKSAVNIIMVQIAGFVAVLGWTNVFLVYLMGVIGVIFCLASFPKGGALSKQNASDKADEKQKRHIDAYVIVGFLTMFVAMMMSDMTVKLSLSQFVVSNGFGGPVETATASNVYMVVGIITSVVFGIMNKKIGWKVAPLGFLVGAIGGAILAFGGSYATTVIGMGLLGFCWFAVTPAFIFPIKERYNKESSALATSIVLAGINLGGFCNAFYTGIVQSIFPDTYLNVIFILVGIVYLVLGVVFAVFNPTKAGVKKSVPAGAESKTA